MILKPNLHMQNCKIDPKMGKTDPHLENMESFSTGLQDRQYYCCNAKVVITRGISARVVISAHIAGVKIICDYMENFSPG